MKISCSLEAKKEIEFLTPLYEIEARDFSSFRSLKKLKESKLFFVSWPNQKSLFWLKLALRFNHSGKLIVFCDNQEKDFRLSSQDKNLLFRANRIICPSLENARHGSLALIYWKTPEKFREINYGVNLQEYSPRTSLQPSSSPIIAKFKEMVNFVTKKIIKKGLPNILVAGKTEDCRDFLENSGIRGRFEYFNYEETDRIKKIKIYQNADIFLVPDKTGDGQVHKIIEALACGLCILAPRSGKLSNTFDHDKQGLFFKPGDHEDLLEKLALLCNDEEKREEMSRLARKLAEGRYDEKRRSEKIKTIVKELEK